MDDRVSGRPSVQHVRTTCAVWRDVLQVWPWLAQMGSDREVGSWNAIDNGAKPSASSPPMATDRGSFCGDGFHPTGSPVATFCHD